MDIYERLQKHKQAALKYVEEEQIIAVCLVGSQNYGLDIETSDIDTKIIIVPSLGDIYSGKRPTSRTYAMENGEQFTIKDIREFTKELLSESPSIMQILFTEYSLVSDFYKKFWDELLANRETIGTYNINKLILSSFGESRSYRDKMYLSPKYLVNYLRVYYFLMSVLGGNKYAEAFIINSKELKELRMMAPEEVYKIYTPEKLQGFELALLSMKEAAENNLFPMQDSLKVKEILDNFIKSCIDKHFASIYLFI